MTDDLLARLLDKVEGRYYGKHAAFVVDNADPESRGRLRLRIPSVLGNDVVSGWALPCVPYGGAAGQGFYFIPEKDANVWVEFEAGNLDFPIWVGSFWSKPGGSTEVPKPGDSQSPPTRKIIRTLKGNSIEMEDKDSDEVFIIKYNDGSNTNVVTMDKNGIQIVDANQNEIKLDQNGTVIQDKNSNKIEMTASSINIIPAVQCNLGDSPINLVNNLPACLFTGAPHAMDAKGHAQILK
jgi:uncharacterized protein involved in type VI secretion and phage assembly